MTDLEASEIVEILEAAYPTWPLTKKTVGLYASVLVELDFDVAKDVVTEIIKSGREFAPPVGLIHSRAWPRTCEKFHRELFSHISRQLIESSVDELTGLIDADKAAAAIAEHRAVKNFGLPPAFANAGASWVVLEFMRKHPARFLPEQVPPQFLRALPARETRQIEARS
jgi:hypothetical protein